MQSNTSSYAPWVDTWLATPRFERFIMAAGNNRQRALDIYQWNTALNSAFLHDFAHFEVALRNAVDVELSAHFGQAPHWVEDTTLLLVLPMDMKKQRNGTRYDSNSWLRNEVSKSRGKFTKPNRHGIIPQLEPGKVVADLSLGCWVDMFASRHETNLWTPALNKAFLPGTDRQKLYGMLLTLKDFRNRVAHHEPTLKDAQTVHRTLYSVLRLISKDVLTHVQAHSAVPTYLASRP